MKKIICILIALITIMLLISCGTSDVDPTDTSVSDTSTSTTPTHEPTKTVESEKIQYTTYVEYTLDDDNTELGDEFASMHLWTIEDSFQYIFELDGVEQTKTFVFEGNEYTMEYEGSWHIYFNKEKTQKITRSYVMQPEYCAEFSKETGELVFFRMPRSLYEDGNFKEDEAKAEAIEFIKSRFGENALEEYPLCEVEDENYRICVSFARKIKNAYALGDCIKVYFDKSGVIRAFNATYFGFIDDEAVEKITEERLTAAEEALKTSLPDSFEFAVFKEIDYDCNTGVCYLSVWVLPPDKSEWICCHINIF